MDGLRPVLLFALGLLERGLDYYEAAYDRVAMRRFLKDNPGWTFHETWTDGT